MPLSSPASAHARDLAPRFYPFWSINGPLDQARLRQQMRDLQTAGMDGVVFHPRFYPGIPPYMSPDYLREVSDAILYAKEIGLRFWIYDENGWPSGTADGQLLAKFPASAAVRLDLFAEPPANALGSFHVDAHNALVPPGTPGARTWHMAPRTVEGIDALNPGVMHQFLDLIHERYRTGLAPAAWDYVEAFFTDEPESGAIKPPMPDPAGAPWSPVLAEQLRARFGPDFAQRLPLVFAHGEGAAEFRVQYWELVTDLFAAGFLAPYRAWCDAHGKKFLGHIKGEEHPLFQLPMGGSFHRLYRQFSAPGIDSLERFPSLDFYPRQAAAVARQFGDGRCMVEAFGGAGWGASPEDLERYLLWLGRHGLTDFVMHLSQYRLDTPAITDWPPSEPLHLTWRDVYPEVLRRVKAELAAHPPAPVDTLVVAPYRGLMAVYEPWELMHTNQHNASTVPATPASRLNAAFLAQLNRLKAAGIAYDVTDERTLEEEGRCENGRIHLGRMSYARLIVDAGAELRGAPATWPRADLESLAAAPAAPVADTPTARPSREAAALDWRIVEAPENAWLLEPTREADGLFSATFDLAFSPAAQPPLRLAFADTVVALSVDDRPIAFLPNDDGTGADLPPLADGPHILRFRTSAALPRAWCWLRGKFTVLSRSAWADGPTATRRTRGPFFASATPPPANAELTAAGYPFLGSRVVAETMLTVPAGARALHLLNLAGDAVRVELAGVNLGWTWGPAWSVALPPHVTPGAHRVRLELVPSTFNTFGPHRYLYGDWPVVSPDQIIGRKNFADPADAPEHTHGPDWHFKPLRLPAKIAFA
ncbi:hypothetical protein K0B96_00680 [Horticoccus luteus]|uniref:Alpha-L-rhamnosidase-like protein n=1 Tax=Horticoccus luteus TaxID=2862869 RepID=A0A8F9XJY7_9BACT|nr:hypothetical protein [Horticoccus luteus]QYM79163.1 hypothetical protein K0B96_00680 [Horticoccus luteus]